METRSETKSGQPEWLKGKGGRPKGGDEKYANDPSALAKRYTAEAIRSLRRIARECEKTDPTIAIRAWALLLERGHGKPSQHQTVENTKKSIKLIERVIVDGRQTRQVVDGGQLETIEAPENEATDY